METINIVDIDVEKLYTYSSVRNDNRISADYFAQHPRKPSMNNARIDLNRECSFNVVKSSSNLRDTTQDEIRYTFKPTRVLTLIDNQNQNIDFSKYYYFWVYQEYDGYIYRENEDDYTIVLREPYTVLSLDFECEFLPVNSV
jgi:hypothetical protein